MGRTIEDDATVEIPVPPQLPRGGATPGGHGRGWLLFGGVILCVAAALGLITAVSPGARDLFRESFTRLPENYTELFFVDTPRVEFDASGRIVHTTVTVRRHGANDADYTVEAVLVANPAGISPRADQHLALHPEQSATLAFSLAVPAGTVDATLDIDIVGGSETLHYRIPATDFLSGHTP